MLPSSVTVRFFFFSVHRSCIYLNILCYTGLGSQALNYYRYGSKKDCSGKWDDFTFCLKTKTKSSEEADVIRKEGMSKTSC